MPTETTARIDNITSVTAESRHDRPDPKRGAVLDMVRHSHHVVKQAQGLSCAHNLAEHAKGIGQDQES
jgi:hypothetical protein